MDPRESTQPADLTEYIGGAAIVGAPKRSGILALGRNDKQQDSVAVITPNKRFLTGDRSSHYEEAFKSAQRYLKACFHITNGGTTALMVDATFDHDQQTWHTRSANMGDSTAFLIVYNSMGMINHAKSRMLNALHGPHNSKERARVEEAKGVIGFEDRLDGKLSCYRGFTREEITGLGTEPEILEEKVQLQDGEQAILIAASDGMLDGHFWEDDTAEESGRQAYCNKAIAWIGSALSPQELLSEDPCHLAAKLIQKSTEKSPDNITILVQRLSPDRSCLPMGVFDGFGQDGKAASFDVSGLISLCLGEFTTAEELLINEKQAQSSDAIDYYLFLKQAGLTRADSREFVEALAELKTKFENHETVNKAVIETCQQMKDIINNPQLIPNQKVRGIRQEIDSFIKKIDQRSVPQKIGIAACRFIGAIAGLLLTPIAPIAVSAVWVKDYLNHAVNPTYGKAFVVGFAGFILGCIFSPLVGMGMGDNLVKLAIDKLDLASSLGPEATNATQKIKGMKQTLFSERSPAKKVQNPAPSNQKKPSGPE